MEQWLANNMIYFIYAYYTLFIEINNDAITKTK